MVGRAAERAAVGAVLEAARRGDGAALVLRGEPGAGKSVLLADAAASAGDLRVLRVRGAESESPLAYAALHRLLRPLLRDLGALPRRQAAALGAALGVSDQADEGPVDRFVVYLAVLSLLSEASATTATLVVVDDVHWLDDASRDALLFVARRVDGERLGLLLAAREDADLDDADVPTLRVAGLDPAAVRTLLEQAAGGTVPDVVVQRLHARTGGNALALSELADALPRDVLLGAAPLPTDLPLTGGVEAAFLERYRALDVGARTVVLVAAADDSGDLRTVEDAARSLGADEAALAAAERSGLVARAGARIEMRHPLVRSAVYAGATTPERRAVHRALADALRAPQDADRRAWHRAAAADRPDESVVAELEASARRFAEVGGHEAASAAWERAAELTAAPDRRSRRLLHAAAAAWTGGRPERAGTLADAALLGLTDPLLRADAALLRARVEWNTGSVPVAHRRLLSEAASVAPHDPSRARELAMFAASLAATTHLEAGPDPLAFVGTPTTPHDHCVAQVLRAFVHLSRHEWGPAVAAVRAAEAHAGDTVLDIDGLLAMLGMAAMHVAADDVAQRLHDRLLAEARESGALIMVLYALTRRGAVGHGLGRWDEVAQDAREALSLAEATGRRGLTAMPLAWLALLGALRDEPDAAARLSALEAVAAAEPMGTTGASVRDQLLWTRAVAADSPSVALHHYEQMRHGFAERMVALDRIETAVRAGRHDLAERWTVDIARFAEGTGSAWAAAVAAHGRAILAEGAEVGAGLERAVALHEGSPRRVDAARTRLAYGEWLRRERRRVDARVHLRAALQTFEDVGAERWAQRARQELRASGERSRRRDEDTTARPSLTPTELQVAQLVAEGLSTREAAARLFVSPRTVDFHLRNVFAKLGITSRAELARAALG